MTTVTPTVVPYKLDVVTLAGPSITFCNISEADVQHQVETMSEGPAGHPAKMFGAVKTAKPMTTFTTPQIDLVAANIPIWGLSTGSTIYQKLSTGVAPASRATTQNRKFVSAQGIAYWSSISLPSREMATASITLCSIYNGSAEPLVPTASVALGGSLIAGNYYQCGPIWFIDNAATPTTTNILQVDSIQIDSGCQFRSDGDASSIFDTYGEVTISDAVVTIKTKAPVNVSSWPLEGTGLTSFRFFARAFQQGGNRIADATAAHIEFSGTGTGSPLSTIAMIVPVNSTANGQNLYADTFKMTCYSVDGVTPPIVMQTAQAIA